MATPTVGGCLLFRLSAEVIKVSQKRRGHINLRKIVGTRFFSSKKQIEKGISAGASTGSPRDTLLARGVSVIYVIFVICLLCSPCQRGGHHDGLGDSGEQLALSRLGSPYKISFTTPVLAVSALMPVSVMTAIPLKLEVIQEPLP